VEINELKARGLQLIRTYSFSLVSVLSFGITFLQNFIFAALLERELFGKIFLLSSLFSLFSYLFVFGLDTAVFKFYYDSKFTDKKLLTTSIFSTWALLSTGLFILVMIVGYIVIEILNYNFIKFDLMYSLLVISGMMFSFFLIFQQYFVASKQIWLYTMVSLGIRLIILIANLGTIFLFGGDLNFFVYSYFISTSIIFIALLFYLDIFRLLKGSREFVRDIFSFSYPLAINSVLGISFTNGYRVLISSTIPFGGLALFGMISQISSAYYIGLSSLLLPHNPAAYQYLQEGNGSKKSIPSYKNKCLQLGIGGFVVVLGTSFLVLKYFKGGEYFDGFLMLPILLLAQFFFLLYSHEYIVLSYYKITSRITFSTTIGIVLMLSIFYFLTSTLGVWGACIVMLIGYIGQYFSAIIFKQRIKLT
jgi:O-antigen/teichoic acid export membrane protein